MSTTRELPKTPPPTHTQFLPYEGGPYSDSKNVANTGIAFRNLDIIARDKAADKIWEEKHPGWTAAQARIALSAQQLSSRDVQAVENSSKNEENQPRVLTSKASLRETTPDQLVKISLQDFNLASINNFINFKEIVIQPDDGFSLESEGLIKKLSELRKLKPEMIFTIEVKDCKLNLSTFMDVAKKFDCESVFKFLRIKADFFQIDVSDVDFVECVCISAYFDTISCKNGVNIVGEFDDQTICNIVNIFDQETLITTEAFGERKQEVLLEFLKNFDDDYNDILKYLIEKDRFIVPEDKSFFDFLGRIISNSAAPSKKSSFVLITDVPFKQINDFIKYYTMDYKSISIQIKTDYSLSCIVGEKFNSKIKEFNKNITNSEGLKKYIPGSYFAAESRKRFKVVFNQLTSCLKPAVDAAIIVAKKHEAHETRENKQDDLNNTQIILKKLNKIAAGLEEPKTLPYILFDKQ